VRAFTLFLGGSRRTVQLGELYCLHVSINGL
jgi:hypothetical protein